MSISAALADSPPVASSSVPPHLPDALPAVGVKGWQVPGGAARSLGEGLDFCEVAHLRDLEWNERG